MQQDPNYGSPNLDKGQQDHGTPVGEPGVARVPMGMSESDERTWSMLSHLSVLLTLITGIGGMVVALAIWLIFRERSGRVAFHALQSLWYQVAWAAILLAFGIGTLVLSIVTLGLASIVLVPLAFVLALVPLVHQVYAAVKVNGGMDYRYPIVADMVDKDRSFDRGRTTAIG